MNGHLNGKFILVLGEFFFLGLRGTKWWVSSVAVKLV